MSKRFWLVAVPFVAGAMIALTTESVWAWTQQNTTPNGNYDFNYGPTDDKYKSGNSTDKSDPNSPGFHFNVQNGQSSNFHSFGSSGFGSSGFGSSGSANAPPSQPYFRTFGN